MEPTKTHSSLNVRLVALILALAVGLPFLVIGGLVFLVYFFVAYEMRPHYDSVTWHYNDFSIVGSPSYAESLGTEGVLPANIEVDAVRSRFVPPDGEVIELDGRRIALSTISWDSAIAMSLSEPLRLRDGEDVVELLDRTGNRSSCLTVHFEQQKFKSLTAWSHVRIYNTSNGQYLDFQAKWSDVERVFGKPNKKEKKRNYHGKWV